MAQRDIKEAKGADDIRFDERRGAVDRPIDMALGGKMHDCVRAELGEQAREQHGIADVALDQPVTRAAGKVGDGTWRSGISPRIKVGHLVTFGQQLAAHRRADEAGTAGYDYPQQATIPSSLEAVAPLHDAITSSRTDEAGAAGNDYPQQATLPSSLEAVAGPSDAVTSSRTPKT